MRQTLGFLMTREAAHQLSFEKALYAIEPNFPPGKMPVEARYTKIYFDMSQGPGNAQGPWNSADKWQVISEREEQCAVDGGDGSASVKLSADEAETLQEMAERTQSDPDSDPTTGAELGMNGAGNGLGEGAGPAASQRPRAKPHHKPSSTRPS